MPPRPLAFCKRTLTLTFFDNFSALCPLLPPSLQVKEKHIAFAPRDVPELRDGSIAVNIRLSSGRSFRGNSAEPPPWRSSVCVEGVGGGGRVWLWMAILAKGSCCNVALPFSPPPTSRLPFTFFFSRLVSFFSVSLALITCVRFGSIINNKSIRPHFPTNRTKCGRFLQHTTTQWEKNKKQNKK